MAKATTWQCRHCYTNHCDDCSWACKKCNLRSCADCTPINGAIDHPGLCYECIYTKVSVGSGGGGGDDGSGINPKKRCRGSEEVVVDDKKPKT